MIPRGYSGRSTNVVRVTSTGFVSITPPDPLMRVLVVDNINGVLKTSATASTPPTLQFIDSGLVNPRLKVPTLLTGAGAAIQSAVTSFVFTGPMRIIIDQSTSLPDFNDFGVALGAGGGSPTSIDITVHYHWE